MPRAIVIRSLDEPTATGAINTAAVEDIDIAMLGDDDVLIEVHYSDLNYKDGLALTGKPGIVRSTPLIGGADLVGTVVESASPAWNPGDEVILNGIGMSETRHGGFCELARVPAGSLVKLPSAFTQAQAAAIGTAGYTAALCVLRLMREGIDASYPVVVTGATGGVGSIAVAMLDAAHCPVAAVTGRADHYGDYLRELGAGQIIDRAEFLGQGKPLQQARWAGGIDTVGGEMLANLLAQTRYGGTVAACGLAGSPSLPATVMPFILRNVTLAGIDSVHTPLIQRQAAWEFLAATLPLDRLESATLTVSLDDAIPAAHRLMNGQAHGRIVVDIRASTSVA
ncbi:MAG TPA: MDR family oxidoreductase [Propionicimonas sp.]|nr:MDR family oxidoreductase [Propionicimonas sp.]